MFISIEMQLSTAAILKSYRGLSHGPPRIEASALGCSSRAMMLSIFLMVSLPISHQAIPIQKDPELYPGSEVVLTRDTVLA